MAGIYRNWDAAAYTAFCRKFELPPKKKYNDYSAGMQRKLCIAVALAHHPKLLLLDEATNGLDPVVRDEVIDLLLDFARDEEPLHPYLLPHRQRLGKAVRYHRLPAQGQAAAL